MVRYFLRIVLFSLPIAVVVILLPESDYLRYHGLEHECAGRSDWMYDRIYKNPKPVDIAFIGSSHTTNAVEDALIMREGDSSVSVVNLGFCRLGRDFQYQLISDLLEHKEVKTIVLELREFEGKVSHPVFPYLSTTKNVFNARVFKNPDYFQNIWRHLVYKSQLFQDYLFQDSVQKRSYRDTGFPEWVETRVLQDNHPLVRSPLVRDDAIPTFPYHYLSLIKNLCDAKKVKLVFLYLPSYNCKTIPSFELTYNHLGKTLVVPDSILSNRNNWVDTEHFNHYGAVKLSRWLLSEQLQEPQ